MPQSNFNWLPPLSLANDGHEAHTTVKIFRKICQPRRREENITLNFAASVDFVSENKDPSRRQEKFCGLIIDEGFCQENVAGIIEDILRNFPYFGERITFTKSRYDKSSEELSSADEALQGIDKFVAETMEKNYDRGMDVYTMELEIRQEIPISDETLRLWHSWLAAMNESDGHFEDTWMDEINRPRTEEELVNMARDPPGMARIIQVVETAQSCPICLDDIFIGSLAIKLSCGHVFGDDCLKKWLKSSDTCPMCRSCILVSSFENLCKP